MSILNRLSIQSKLIIALLLVSGGSILAVSYIGYRNGVESMRQSVEQQLEGRRAEKQQQVHTFLTNLRNQVVSVSDRPATTAAMSEFRDAYHELQGTKMEPAWEEKLEEFYRQVFIPGLAKNLGVNPVLEQYLPRSVAGRYLQYNYIATNPNRYGLGMRLDQAADGSQWSQVHEKYHSQFDKAAKLFGLEDIFLIDADNLDIVYSYQKTAEFATNLERGPYADSNLGQLAQELVKAKDRDDYRIADFEAYRPNFGKPSSFVGSPIFDGNKMIGILVFQFPIDQLNIIMTGSYQWKEQGLGSTGEVYLVGGDQTMRSPSRFMLEDQPAFLDSLREAGVLAQDINQMQRQGSPLLVLPVHTAAVEQALEGKQGVTLGRDYRDMPVLSAFGPVEVNDSRWAIIAEMDLAEAYAPAAEFSRRVLIAATAIALLTSLLALLLSRMITRPLKLLTDGARRISAGEEDVQVEVDTRDEFRDLADAFNEMSGSLKTKTEQLRQVIDENEELLLNILPAPVAARHRDGDGPATQSFAEVTVLMAHITGFEQTAQAEGADAAALGLMHDLVVSFDSAADKFGVEKVKTVGASYLAVCGLSVPRPDHINRMIEFARELVRIIQRFNRDRGRTLVLEIGINNGPVVGGIVGRTKFIYDLWGDTVTIAQGMDSDGTTTIKVTQSVYERMRDLYPFLPAQEFEVKGKGRFPAWVLAD